MSLTVLLTITAMLLLNSLFAAYELALASVRADRLKYLIDQHRPGARAALYMKNRMEGSLAVVQLGITLVGAIAAAVGGASADETFTPLMKQMFGLESDRVAKFLALSLFVVPLSAVTIIVGELIPKVLAIKNNEWVVTVLSPGMWVFSLVTFPAVWIFEMTTKIVVMLVERVLPLRGNDDQGGLHELRAQVNLLRASKVIGLQEERIILQASRLSTIKVGEIMMPTEDIVMALADAPLSENLVIAHMDLHTRFPVTVRRGDPEGIIGYVTFKDMVLLAKTHPGNPVLREIVRQLVSLPIDLPVSEALKRMIAEHQHLALVRGPGGKVVGMITQEDIFEELVGDIQDEFDRLPRHMSPSGHQWVVGGGVTLAQLKQTLKNDQLGEELAASTSLNEWLNRNREHPLRGGDMLVVDGVWAQIRKVRRKRVTEALLDPLGDPFDPNRNQPAESLPTWTQPAAQATPRSESSSSK